MLLEINTETKQISVVKFKEMESFNSEEIRTLLMELGNNLTETVPVKISETVMDMLNKGSVK